MIDKNDIDENFKIPAIPQQPKLMTPEEKEKRQGILDEEIKKLENQRSNIISNINEFKNKIKRHRKPDEIYQAEDRKRKLLDSKKKLYGDVDNFNKEKKEVLKYVQGFDDKNKNSKGKKTLPQDEEELEFMMEGWND